MTFSVVKFDLLLAIFIAEGRIMSGNFEEKVIEAISEPRSASIDGVRVENHSLRDTVEAARFLKEQAVDDPFACVRHRQIRFEGPR